MSTNTKTSFQDKWTNNPDLAYNETLREGSDIFNWILNRNGFNTPDDLRSYLSGKKRVLDAGCGNGRVTALLRRYSDPVKTAIMGIDLVSAEIAAKNLAGESNVSFASKNLLDDLTDLGSFDFIYSQEVLHHTGNPEKAFSNLVRLLSDGGEIAIYVYKKKAPLREYTDDMIRDAMSRLPYEKAMEMSAQITELGKALSDLNVRFHSPAVDVMGIEAGEYTIQRFVYHYFMKCFWNDNLEMQANTAINYDWYHPQDCTRHTLGEVLEWYQKAGLTVTHQFVDHYGITVRGKKGRG